MSVKNSLGLTLPNMSKIGTFGLLLIPIPLFTQGLVDFKVKSRFNCGSASKLCVPIY